MSASENEAPVRKLTMVCDPGDRPLDEEDKRVIANLASVAAQKGMDFRVGKIEACKTCQFFECICELKRLHKEHCPLLKAAACPIAISCDHGLDVCPQCDACTCFAPVAPNEDSL